MLDTVGKFVSILANIAILLGAFITFWQFRHQILQSNENRIQKIKSEKDAQIASERESLLLNDVRRWAIETIEILAAIAIIMENQALDPDDKSADLSQQSNKLSTKIEVGRIFFQNTPTEWGSWKEKAYRGLRPEILDMPVAVFDGCTKWRNATPEYRMQIARAVRLAEQRFVSFSQAEVGRERTHSGDTSRAGYGAPLERLLREIDNQG